MNIDELEYFGRLSRRGERISENHTSTESLRNSPPNVGVKFLKKNNSK